MDQNEFDISSQIQKSGIVINGKKYNSLQEVPLDQIPAPLRQFLKDSDGNGMMDFMEKGLLGKFISSQMKNVSNKDAMAYLQKMNSTQNVADVKTDDYYDNDSVVRTSGIGNGSNQYKSIEVEGAGKLPILIFVVVLLAIGVISVYYFGGFPLPF